MIALRDVGTFKLSCRSHSDLGAFQDLGTRASFLLSPRLQTQMMVRLDHALSFFEQMGEKDGIVREVTVPMLCGKVDTHKVVQ